MKPHFYKEHGVWWCRMEFDRVAYVVAGMTPAHAWQLAQLHIPYKEANVPQL